MSYIAILLTIIIVLLMIQSRENMVECTSCDSYMTDDGSSVMLNPYVWPYSGSRSVDDIRVLEKDRGVNPAAGVPIAQASVPDHAAKTN